MKNMNWTPPSTWRFSALAVLMGGADGATVSRRRSYAVVDCPWWKIGG
jgi:hypothetical protein